MKQSQKFIPYGRQWISDDDIAEVVRVLRSDFLTCGPEVERFEQAFAEKVRAPFAVSCSNGTAGLHLAMLAAGIKQGDRVLTSPITFVASANCARYVGATAEFADINPDSFTLCPESASRVLETGVKEGKPFSAVVTVDLAGQPCAMEAFSELKRRYNLVWVQDACHSIGSGWKSSRVAGVSTGESLPKIGGDSSGFRLVGESPEPDMTVFSFHPVKHITTGEGGMVTTHSEKMAERLRLNRSHGITRDPQAFKDCEAAFDNDGVANPWYYEMHQPGFNYRLTDIQAALGRSQLKKLDQFISRRREIAGFYQSGLEQLHYVTAPSCPSDVFHSYHLALLQIDFEGLKLSRASFINRLKDRGVGSQVHYIPVPMLPFYREQCDLNTIPRAVEYYRKTLSVPCFPAMNDGEVECVIDAIKAVAA